MTAKSKSAAAIYTRISRDIEGSGLGVERQLEDCRRYATTHGLTVSQVYSDNDISASGKKHRPGYEKMLSDMEAGTIGAVIAWHPDRLHRKTLELERYIAASQAHGVTTYTVQAGLVDLTSASGRAVAKILGSIAQQESELKAERIQRQKLQAAKAGKYLGGRIPWGWQIKAGVVAVEPTAAKFIRDGVQAILEGSSLNDVTRQWADAGALSLSGTRMNTTQVRRVLLRSRNAGLVTFHGEPVSGDWPAIVSVEDFRAVEARLNDKTVPRQSAAKFKYLLSGLALCYCGRYMTGYGAQATSEKPHYRRMYRCRVHQEGGRFVRGHAIREMHRLDGYVLEVIAAYISRPDVRDAVLSASREETASAGDKKPADTSELLTRKQDLARLFAAGVIEESQLIEGTAQIRAELSELERAATRQTGSRELAAILMASDPANAFLSAETGVQRSVLKALGPVKILEGAKQGAPFNPELVRFPWQESA
jgi:site-specific DNA recombinase